MLACSWLTPVGILTLVLRKSSCTFEYSVCLLGNNRTGIGPESFAFVSSDGDFTGDGSPSLTQLAFNQKNGFYITSSVYILRPEVLESNFYAFRVTGDAKYLRRAARVIDSFNNYLTVTHGFAGLVDVNGVNSNKIDDTESFWFAEVLKYLYVFDAKDC